MRYYRKVIRITAEDSPNVWHALNQRARGETPAGETILPGVLPWEDYVKRRATWDKVRQCIGLDGRFWEGADILMFPPDWLNRAALVADALRGRPRQAKGIGIDPGEGEADTAFAAVDELGLIDLMAKKTPNTAIVTSEALAFMRKHGVAPERVCFDAGGGGKQHADRLREMGYPVRTVAFGASPSLEPKRGLRRIEEKKENIEDRNVYFNLRAEMYDSLRLLLDPVREPGFGLPREYVELRRQLSPIPLTREPDGRLKLIPKDKADPNSKKPTLRELIGCSPDHVDALVLAIYAMQKKSVRPKAGAVG